MTLENGAEHQIEVHLDKLLADRGMTLTQLSEEVGVTIVNLSILKNGRAKAIRFSTLTALCEALDCQPGDLMSWRDGERD
ncbi:MAG: helix-turn-helix transcriptional regulator [Actinobacteria bacterium]|nr:helix-turn-helix transcriptional regulator [Actinomycetota bacterium]